MQFFLMSEGQIGPQEGHTGGPYKWAPDQWARGKGQDHESQTVCNRSSSSGQPLLSQSTSQLVNQ